MRFIIYPLKVMWQYHLNYLNIQRKSMHWEYYVFWKPFEFWA